MSILDYTSYEEIRAVLGVSDDELEDETLALDVYYTGLLIDLGEIDAEIGQTFLDLPPEEQQTPLQKKFSRLAKMFSTYSVAKQLLPALPMFAPRSLSDGKASMARFLDPYKDTIKGVNEKFDFAKGKLEDVWDEMNSETREPVEFRPFFAVGLARDPVTQSE